MRLDFFRGPVGLDVAPGMPHIEIDEDVRQERPKLAGNCGETWRNLNDLLPCRSVRHKKTRRWDQTRLARFIFPLKISKVKKNAIEYIHGLFAEIVILSGFKWSGEMQSDWRTRPESTCVNHDWHNAWEIPIKRWVICENEDGRWGI